MTYSSFSFVALMTLVIAAGARGTCLPTGGGRILGSDLAAADARFSALPVSLQLGYAPIPGTTRVFAPAELQRIARANGIAMANVSEVCFEVPLHAPTDTEFVEPMQRALPHGVDLHLLDRSHSAIPAGIVEFPLSGLDPAAGYDGDQLWRGFIQYTDTRRIAVWARVGVRVSYSAVLARTDLGADSPIEAAALKMETRSGPLKREPTATRLEQVTGRILQHPLKAGMEIPVSLLRDPPAVRRGDSVRVEVQSGRAVLQFDAIAQSNGGAGEMTELRNPVNGRIFRARIIAGAGNSGSKAVIIVGKSPAL